MNIFVRVKAAGRRRDILERRAVVVSEAPQCVEAFIERLVRENVRSYNEAPVDAPFFRFLSEAELADGVYSGKAGFGGRRGGEMQDEDEAVRNALECFGDGFFRVLVNDVPAEPGGEFCLREGDVVTFIRLVMLAGRRF
ncbi:MAG: hypothetical protein LBC67_05985 [Spirochaetales bacterium]|nr:hypothetical protein [Spirochaetales bacterium]